MDETNLSYRLSGRCIVYKKPTPIKVVKTSYPNRNMCKITEAYFTQPSTTDYNGVIFGGRYIDFEAKQSSNTTSLPLKNVHEHQVTHMKQVIKQNGICFLIIRFTKLGETYLLDASHLISYWEEQSNGGRKSIPREEIIKKGHLIPHNYKEPINYMEIVEKVYL